MPIYQLSPLNADGPGLVLSAKAVTIGRHPENVLALNDTLLSRYHCVIEAEQNGFRIRDLESRNGTKVNGQRITDIALAPGDVLKIGTHEFVVEAEETLAERQKKAKSTAQRSPENASWLVELTELIKMLPPKGDIADRVVLIDSRGKVSRALEGSTDGPRACRMILIGAGKSRATDIHVEPKGDMCSVRMRVDGQMIAVADLPNKVGELMFGVIKTACQFQPSARDTVLDGHFSSKVNDRRVDYRISFTPSVHGQKLVMRVLDQRDAPKSLTDLGLPPYMYERVRQVCEQDAGLLLCCGPTGSGKTTSLYNALRYIDRESKNVVTIEDPVEYSIDNVTQIPVDSTKDNTFGSLLRSVLRQDPDVILVGEIRDEETARTAMRAAMTGHLVFSTVHARDTISSVFRLLDLKVEPYLVANSIEVIIAQRLVRQLCENCKRPVPVSPSLSTRMGRYLEGKTSVFAATGCAECLRTGFRGRKAIFEVLDFTEELKDVILQEPTIQSMRSVIEQGMFTTLVQNGWQHVARGQTTIEEVDRVASAR